MQPTMNPEPFIEFQTGLARSSPFCFGQGIAERFPGHLSRFEFDRCFLITSTKLLQLFGHDLLGRLEQHGIRCAPVLIDDSERGKGWETLRTLCEELAARGVTKDSILLALGGGVVGNVVGLAAGLIYRGIRFVEIPTTITAQTDSTLSNKQAINGALGKNQFGLYHAPLFIWADADYPKSEPLRQQAAGVVEGVKNIFITDDKIDRAIEMVERWRSRQCFGDLLLSLIQSKLPIIARDPSEQAFAMALEYGHTFGHAIEWLAKGKLLHGEAVSIGMCLAAELSAAMGLASEDLVRTHYQILGQLLGTPTHLPAEISPQAVYDTMLADNKRTGKGLRFLLLKDWGQFATRDGQMMLPAERDQVLHILRQSQERGTPVEKLAG
jgi:3-dehydroquinate synthase